MEILKPRYLLLALITALVIFWLRPAVARPDPAVSSPAALEAPALTQSGHQWLSQGQPEAAFKTWEKALQIYRHTGYEEGVSGSLINQSLALQALGQNLRACSLLLEATPLTPSVCDTQPGKNNSETEVRLVKELQALPEQALTVSGLHSLGDVLQGMGQPRSAITVLQQALAIAKRLDLDPAPVQLSLANAQTLHYTEAHNRYQSTEDPFARDKATQSMGDSSRSALTSYQALTTTNPRIALMARLNWLKLSLDLDPKIPALAPIIQQSQAQLQPSLKALAVADFNQLPMIESIYARLKYAHSLAALQSWQQNLEMAFAQTEQAMEAAQAIENQRAIASALTLEGQLYNQAGQPQQSQQILSRAAATAQSIHAWDIAYVGQSDLARLYQRLGNRTSAILSYQQAISHLGQIRKNLLTTNPDLQFTFREDVEPVYRAYMQLLLAIPEPDLTLVIQANEQLQIAELENYLRCGQLDWVSLDDLQQSLDSPTVIHILNLGDQLHVLVRNPQGFHQYTTTAAPVIEQLEYLQINIESGIDLADYDVLKTYSQALYQQTIAPVERYLPPTGTLVFVLDSLFQSVPMAMLYDGRQYLIEKYSISTALGSEVAVPKALVPKNLNVLIAGLSKLSPSLESSKFLRYPNSLPYVGQEVSAIDRQLNSANMLNERFTAKAFQRELNEAEFSVIHVATHGQFSSDPERTFVLAWDRPINVWELEGLLRRKLQRREQFLELLVLSACQTAQGDQRAVLGIAGVAAQSGASSTIASLWPVDDSSTSILMGEFYDQLKQGKSKAEALRQAQLKLIAQPKTYHPFYWSPFLLVGNWR